jgi:hypothetical protein
VIVGGEGRVFVVHAGQQAGRERDPGDDSDSSLPRGRNHLLQRLEAEAVEDDLDGGHVRPLDRT